MTVKNILITGPPRCGKSTLIEKVVHGTKRPMTGFFTRELKERGKRVGFSINRLDGKTGILAHQDIKGPFSVGKYGVNLDHIDRVAVPSMVPAHPDEVVVIDEIGKMECLSERFRQVLVETLNSENPVLASIALKGGPFIQSIKRRKDLVLLPISEKNRDAMVAYVLTRINRKE
jgi:nucleoside-triphosphatase